MPPAGHLLWFDEQEMERLESVSRRSSTGVLDVFSSHHVAAVMIAMSPSPGRWCISEMEAVRP